MSAPYLVITICLLYRLPPADSIPDGRALCKNPNRTMLMMNPDKTFYNIGEEVTFNCRTGYRPFPSSVQCVKRGASNEWDHPPQCFGKCSHPAIPNMLRLPEHKKYYDQYEDVIVKCNPEYYPSSNKVRCFHPHTLQEWHPSNVTCIAYSAAQCKKPDIDNMDRLSIDDDYYNHGEEVTVRCKSGYYPSSDRLRCDFPGTPQEWTPPAVTCIRFRMTDWRVTSTSISAQTSCIPECPSSWSFSIRCCPVNNNPLGCKFSHGKSVKFPGLQPFSVYKVIVTLYGDRESYDLKNEFIKTLESVPDQPEIVTVPSMEDNTVRWRIYEKSREITRFQMNISARRDYNASFAVDESMEFPPNVTEYKIPLQYGTNYTITLRAFTSAGFWKDTTENVETDIGDPLPPHVENTNNSNLHFHSVLDLNGPIRSYEIIVFCGLDGNATKECVKFKNTAYNSSGTPSHYTAAVLPAETLTALNTFILGDDQHYNGFHNAPLIPNLNYSVYIRVTSQWNEVEKYSCTFAALIRGVTTKRAEDSFLMILSHSSLGLIITMISLKFLALVALCVIPRTPWMRDLTEQRIRKRRNISIEDEDQELYEFPVEAATGIQNISTHSAL